MVERQVIVEVKAIESLLPVHEAQVITYLKLTGCPAGLLINFNEVLLKNGLRRLDRPDLYAEKRARAAFEKEPPVSSPSFHSPVKKT
jgi:hypothetical protein